jgi:myo-inositol 2-dehydrogenase / D-chiro-inositol 1-dehydrogenase
MRVLVFGAGRMAETRAHALADDETVHEIVIANRSAPAAEALAVQVGGRSCSLEEAFQLEADAAIVTVATAFHLDILEPLLDRGAAVPCEKPIALDTASTGSIVSRANAAGTLLHVGFQRRFAEEYVMARNAIADGTLGSIYHVRLTSHDVAPSGTAFITASGGIFRDLHVHDFDLAAWLFNSPIRSVYATGSVRVSEQYRRFDDLDNTVIVAELDNGVPVVITGTRQNPRGQDVRAELYGSRDCIDVGGGAASQPRPVPDWPGRTWRRNAFENFMERFEDAFARETRAFIAAVGAGENSLTPGEAALTALVVAEACEVSLREGRPVDVDVP